MGTYLSAELVTNEETILYLDDSNDIVIAGIVLQFLVCCLLVLYLLL